MSTPFDDRLYNLLPSIYRQRDSEVGEPLRALLAVIAEQVNAVEQDMTDLYDNWFIETCADWVVPYIGELIGYRTLHAAAAPAVQSAPRAAARARILFPRRDVANTLRYRRRKGTLSLLDDLAATVSGWPAHAVEFAELIAATQSLKHLRPGRGGTADVRHAHTMERVNSVSDITAHLADLRRPQSRYRTGRYSIAAIGLFVWRLRSYAVTRSKAYCVEEVAPECYTFSVLGNNCPLFDAAADPGSAHADAAAARPVMLRRADVAMADGRVDPRYYGAGHSFALWTDSEANAPIAVDKLVVADLSDWNVEPRSGTVAIDPETGRIAFARGEAPEHGLVVSYHYGFSADIGGGAYVRPMPSWVPPRVSTTAGAAPVARYGVGSDGDFHSLQEALHAWHKDKPACAIIELMANEVYGDAVRIVLEAAQSLEIRAAAEIRPVIRLLDLQANRPDFMAISGEARSRLVLDGLLVTGRGLQIKGELSQLTIRHCTLVPGWDVERPVNPSDAPNSPSLSLVKTRTRVNIEHSILGPMVIASDDPEQEPLQVSISDSIVDARVARHEALGASDGGFAHAALTIARCTVFGIVRVNAVSLAENCIFNDGIEVERIHQGCVRFCYVSTRARTPRRYECQPDTAVAKLRGDERESARRRLIPMFNSTRYGTPTYCQLAQGCAPEIAQGADDESEMGVFHDLYQPQRMANLLARLDEYVPADADAGVITAI